MNVNRTIFIAILLVLVGVRHFLPFDEPRKIGLESLASTLSSIEDVHVKIGAHMKKLIDAEMKAPPDQDYLIMLVTDNLEMINLICFYNHELLETLISSGVTAKYHPGYIEKLKNNMIFEITRIENNMERITSIYPLIREKAVSDTIKESKQIGQTLIRLFEDTVERLDEVPPR